jgi:hypothetical protein
VPKSGAAVDPASTLPIASEDLATIPSRPAPKPAAKSDRGARWLIGSIVGVALIAIGLLVFRKTPTPEPKIEGPKPVAKMRSGPDARLAGWVEAHGGHVVLDPDGFVRAIELKDRPGIADMPPLVHATELRELRLEHCGVTDSAVADLPEMPGLVALGPCPSGRR